MRPFDNVVCVEVEDLANSQYSRRFRPIPTPCVGKSVAASLFFSTGLLLLLGLPWAYNELGPRTTLTRGVIVGVFHCCFMPLVFLVNAPISVCGRFRWQFLLSLPITFFVAFVTVFIPLGDSRFGLLPIITFSVLASFALCSLILNVPLFLNNAHKALDQSIGPPFLFVLILFVFMMTGYIELTRLISGSGKFLQFVVGMSLPFGCFATETCFKNLLKHSYLNTYVKQTLESQTSGQALAGDIDTLFGHLVSLAALLLENAKFVAGILEVTYTPNSFSWVYALLFSTILKILKRVGVWQRVLTKALLKIPPRFDRIREIASTNALKIAFLRSQEGCGYVASIMAVCIGCLRAARFRDWKATIWLDVDTSVTIVIFVCVAVEILQDVITRVAEKTGLVKFPITAAFAGEHPLGKTDRRPFGLAGYLVLFGPGCAIVLITFLAFMGPWFVFGLCKEFDAAAPARWVATQVPAACR